MTKAPTVKDFSRYSPEAEHNGIKMKLIGHWIDLAAHYGGSDGNAWTWSACTGSWANNGPLNEFVAFFGKRSRGMLHEGLCPICGESVYLKPALTIEGRLIGSCGDAFKAEQWVNDNLAD